MLAGPSSYCCEERKALFNVNVASFAEIIQSTLFVIERAKNGNKAKHSFDAEFVPQLLRRFNFTEILEELRDEPGVELIRFFSNS